MAYKVLIVDDSSFFRRRVTDILNQDPNLDVIGVAVNGKEAVERAIALKPDVITMDIEMPVLNGIEAVKQIMAQAPTSILMFSSLTHQGAKATLEALDAGALDFLPKKFSEIARNSEEAGQLLRQRVAQLAKRNRFIHRTLSSVKHAPEPTVRKPASSRTPFTIKTSIRPLAGRESSSLALDKGAVGAIASVVQEYGQRQKLTHITGKKYKLLAIGTSTGGPVALQKILTQLPEDFPLPIVLVQHMPAAFTGPFATRLNSLCKIEVKEAQDGDLLKPGCAYLAPGGRQMFVVGKDSSAKLKIIADDSPKITYRPSVDISFGSAAKVFSGDVLALILTGMGADGRDGARLLKSRGATIWAQDEASCVVYGMPQAVAKVGISTLSLAIEDIPSSILKEIQYG
jgi:two-component system chemotaxis response regulator CheB